MPEIYLSRRKIAARSGLSPNTLKNYADRGVGPAFIRLPGNGKCIYSVAAFDTWLAQYKMGNQA